MKTFAGPTAGKEIDVETIRGEYLLAMDCNPESGKPNRGKVVELGLEDVAEVLWSR